MSTSRDDSPGARQCPACSADSGEPVLAGPDGRCTSCGQPLVINADHVEKDLGQVVGVSDRGLRHHRNEDAFHIAVVPTAAARALAGLVGADGAPAATYVSAVVSRELITISWLGDSRAYWLAAEGLTPGGPNDTIDITGGSRRITRDDSLAEEMVAAGLASMDDAMASPQAHVITRWLGADLPDPLAHIEQFTPTGPGVLLVASDGLWNYRQEAAELTAMVMPAALERPLDAAADLVKFAIDSGGLDNITVVLVPFPPR